jgi:hypothetical protein
MMLKSTEEAIEILHGELTRSDIGERNYRDAITRAVAKLEETHAITRRGARVHHPSDPGHPAEQLRRAERYDSNRDEIVATPGSQRPKESDR